MEFERLIAYFDADTRPLEAAVQSATRLVDALENKFKNFKGKFGAGSGTGIDSEMRKAEAEVKRFQSSRERMERDFSRTVEREARQQSAARTREQRRSANAMIAEINRVNREEKKLSGGPSMLSGFGGKALGALGIGSLGLLAKDFIADSAKLYSGLDKLTRFTATLDRNFQSPEALKKFQADIKQLSTEIPHSAASIAEASFTIKSAFKDITEPELINYLRQFGNAATASNTDIATHAINLAALAKQYNITGNDLTKFSALISTSFGNALASDAKVAAGFNQILNSAKSTKQPLDDMAAAMSTLQSASSNAEQNTTLLLNVYSKLTDPKYIEGMKAMGVSVFDAAGQFRPLNDLINDMAKALQGLSDQQINDKLEWAKDAQAREGIKTLVRLVGDYNKTLSDGTDQDAFTKKNELMLNSAEAKWERFVNKINNFKMNWGALFVDIADFDLKAQMQKSAEANIELDKERAKRQGFSVGTAIGIGMGLGVEASAKYVSGYVAALAGTIAGELISGVKMTAPKIELGLSNAVSKATEGAKPEASQGGRSVGLAMAQGMSAGLSSGQGSVVGTVTGLATAAWQAAKNALGIQSPSKVFFQIGQDTAQGYIDGINAMKASVQSSMASLVDISGVKGLTKKNDAEGVALLTSLVSDIARFNVVTKEQEVRLELTAGKYSKLNKEVREATIAAAQHLDKLNAWNAVTAKVSDLMSRFTEGMIPAKTNVELFNEALAGPEMQANLTKTDEKYRQILIRLLGIAAISKDISENPVGLMPPPDLGTGSGPVDQGTGSGPEPSAPEILAPPPAAPWTSFWGQIQAGLLRVQNTTLTWKQQFQDFAVSIPDLFGNSLAAGLSQYDGTWRSFLEGMKQAFFGTLAQMAAEAARQQLIKGLIGLGTSLFGSFAGGAGGGGDSRIGGFISGGSMLGGFADGGVPPMGRASIVGERGPELFVPNVGGRILSNKDSKDALSGGGGNQITVVNNFHSAKDGSFSRQSAEQAAKAFTATLGRTAQRT